ELSGTIAAERLPADDANDPRAQVAVRVGGDDETAVRAGNARSRPVKLVFAQVTEGVVYLLDLLDYVAAIAVNFGVRWVLTILSALRRAAARSHRPFRLRSGAKSRSRGPCRSSCYAARRRGSAPTSGQGSYSCLALPRGRSLSRHPGRASPCRTA